MDEGRVHIWLSIGSSHPHPRQANSDSLLTHFLLLKGLKQQHFRRRVKGVQKPPARPQRDVWGDREGAPPSAHRAARPALSAQLKTCFQLPVKSELEETY